MSTIPHTIQWAGRTVTVERWVIVDHVNRRSHSFTDPQACADHWNVMKSEPGGAPLAKLEVVMDGRRRAVAPAEAVRPVFEAMGLWEPLP
jgi:hypothetical protein